MTDERPATRDQALAWIDANRRHLREHHSENRPVTCPLCHPAVDPTQTELGL